MPQRSRDETLLLEKASKYLPGGTLGNVSLDQDHSFIVKRGLGSRIWDLSGREYIDYLMGSGPMVLGHAHERVVQAVKEAVDNGSTFFANNQYAVLLAEELVNAVPCAEKVRFTTSGTDACFQALRIARAFRGRDKVLKFEGGFHGTSDYSLMSNPPRTLRDFPLAEASSGGIPRSVEDTVLVAPFNDSDRTTSIIEEHHAELAAVIVEPMQRSLAPKPGFLEALREATTHYHVPLIFDEVVTGFRLAYGGAQERYGVTPDLAAVGKIMGGGYPLAAVCGRARG
jgi:glutamate-1-semialdehyde 2,1-aminomutase